MCGIAGILAPGRQAAELEEVVLRMHELLRHRGPDDEGVYSEEGIALAHNRLSIIDLAGGRQPLTNEDETVFLVVNGEIYNYRSLQEELRSRGHLLRTQSDCEVIVHLYEEHGEGCLDYLDGMFAFALWDGRQKKLILARDRFGVKPLYVAATKDLVCFASELTAIVKSNLLRAQIDVEALYAYLAFSYVPGPLSIMKGVQKLQPAERFVVQNGTLRCDRYWIPQPVSVPRQRSEAVKELAERVKKSVRSHLVADVPVAAFLSGGVDSSTVVAMARKYTNLETFCVSFARSEVDEAPIARRVAEHLKTHHHEVAITIDPASLLNESINFMDEPFADSSALPTFAVCREARKIAKVVLSGDGGDEVFGGYTGRYRVAALKAAIPRPDLIGRGLRSLPPWRFKKRSSLPEMLALAVCSEHERYVAERQITSAADRAALFGDSHSYAYEETLREVGMRPFEAYAHEHPLHRALWVDLMTSLPDDMLTKVDRMSMAHGLEVRVPFLDHRLVEFSLSLPPHWLVSPFPVEGKRILRKLAAPLLPDGILNRPKQGFVVPLNDWLQLRFRSMLHDLLATPQARVLQFLDERAVFTLMKRPVEQKSRDDLYALLVLELWLRRMDVFLK